MNELVRWVRPTIRVAIPPSRVCEAEGCDRGSRAHIVWHDDRAMLLHLNEVCGWHLFRLRDRGCLVFPLDGAPPLEVVAAAYQQEAQRRAMSAYQPMWGGNVWSGGTGTSSFNIRFG